MAQDVPAQALWTTETIRGDTRNLPPSAAFQRLLSESPDPVKLLAFARAASEGAHLALGRQDLSWSVESLAVIAGVSDRFSTLVSSLAGTDPAGDGHRSALSSEVLRARAARKADRDARKAAYQAGKTSKSPKNG